MEPVRKGAITRNISMSQIPAVRPIAPEKSAVMMVAADSAEPARGIRLV